MTLNNIHKTVKVQCSYNNLSDRNNMLTLGYKHFPSGINLLREDLSKKISFQSVTHSDRQEGVKNESN